MKDNSLNEFIIFRDLADDTCFRSIMRLVAMLDSEASLETIRAEYFSICGFLIPLAESRGISGDLVAGYIIHRLISAENPFTLAAERIGTSLSPSLRSTVAHDFRLLKNILDSDVDSRAVAMLGMAPVLSGYIPSELASDSDIFDLLKESWLKEQEMDALIDMMIDFYYKHGAGIVNQARAFRWHKQDGLVPVKKYDPITFDNLVGYNYQKGILKANTEAFLQGRSANNVLLIGPGGTGKSSSVKALLNAYYHQGLRIVEILQSQLGDLSLIFETLGERGCGFILFIDDLSFEEFETEYKQLKSVIEGSLEQRPDNVLIYATSNRRHLIKEQWSDRTGESMDVHLTDTMSEKLSLAERFGITLLYSLPDQEEFFHIVKELAREADLAISEKKLIDEARRWSISHSGRSGRIARQFIDYFSGMESLKDVNGSSGENL